MHRLRVIVFLYNHLSIYDDDDDDDDDDEEEEEKEEEEDKEEGEGVDGEVAAVAATEAWKEEAEDGSG